VRWDFSCCTCTQVHLFDKWFCLLHF
jgi:hypothetical protein